MKLSAAAALALCVIGVRVVATPVMTVHQDTPKALEVLYTFTESDFPAPESSEPWWDYYGPFTSPDRVPGLKNWYVEFVYSPSDGNGHHFMDVYWDRADGAEHEMILFMPVSVGVPDSRNIHFTFRHGIHIDEHRARLGWDGAAGSFELRVVDHGIPDGGSTLVLAGLALTGLATLRRPR